MRRTLDNIGFRLLRKVPLLATRCDRFGPSLLHRPDDGWNASCRKMIATSAFEPDPIP
jgi:hypothetical protein